MNDDREAWKVAKAMMKYGGDFVSHLGQALLRADPNNAQKIKTAFPDYWEEYLGIYERFLASEEVET